MYLDLFGVPIDLLRLVVSLLAVLSCLIFWLAAEPVIASLVPQLPIPRRTSTQRTLLFVIALVDGGAGLALMLVLEFIHGGL